MILAVAIATVIIFVLFFANRVRKFKKSFQNRAQGQRSNQQNQAEQETQRKKVYSQDVGEYVSFEEIKVDESEQRTQPKKQPESKYDSEPLITDAEFEEIKD